MIYLQCLNDIKEVNRVILDPSVNDDISCDDTKGIAFELLSEQLEFTGVFKDGVLSGLFMLVPINQVTAEIHTCLLPSIHGKNAMIAGRLLLSHLFTKYQKAISWVPSPNRKALIYALKLGFQVEGVNRASFLKNGELVDQKLVGLTKGDYLCQ